MTAVGIIIGTVENNHIARENLFLHHRTHIVHIHIKSRRIHCCQRLYDHPSLRHLCLKDLVHAPGSIVLNENLLRLERILNLLQFLWCELFFGLNACQFEIDGGKFCLVVFFFTIFTHNDNAFGSIAKFVFEQCLLH